jgi:hypothetical protein
MLSEATLFSATATPKKPRPSAKKDCSTTRKSGTKRPRPEKEDLDEEGLASTTSLRLPTPARDDDEFLKPQQVADWVRTLANHTRVRVTWRDGGTTRKWEGEIIATHMYGAYIQYDEVRPTSTEWICNCLPAVDVRYLQLEVTVPSASPPLLFPSSAPCRSPEKYATYVAH